MNKFMIRRIGAIITLLSFFFTWYKNVDSYGTTYSGIKLITEGFSEKDGAFVAIIVLITAAIGILTLIYPKVISLILSILAGTLWSLMFLGSTEMSNFRGLGSYILMAGYLIIVLSIFFKKPAKNQELIQTKESA